MIKVKKEEIPKCSIVPGILDVIDYAELIKRDASNVYGTIDVPKKEQPKTKVYSNKEKSRRK